ncbi:MAG TPA: hypothetical protein VFV88_03120 [Steroidobacteraceae bacterium]|nr:hypothetical protein [Steroidobacteraceae bacterium]
MKMKKISNARAARWMELRRSAVIANMGGSPGGMGFAPRGDSKR